MKNIEIKTNFKGNDIVVGFQMSEDKEMFKRQLERALNALKKAIININEQ